MFSPGMLEGSSNHHSCLTNPAPPVFVTARAYSARRMARSSGCISALCRGDPRRGLLCKQARRAFSVRRSLSFTLQGLQLNCLNAVQKLSWLAIDRHRNRRHSRCDGVTNLLLNPRPFGRSQSAGEGMWACVMRWIISSLKPAPSCSPSLSS